MSEPKARYNVTIPGELDNLQRYLQTLAAIIANLPNGEEHKQLFDLEYCKHRARYVRLGSMAGEVAAAEHARVAEAGLK